jgi:flagellar biosynthesis protein FliR
MTFLLAAALASVRHMAALIVVNISLGNLVPLRVLTAMAFAFGAATAEPVLPGFGEAAVLAVAQALTGAALALVVVSALWGAQAAGEYLANAVGLGFAVLPAANGLPQLAVLFQRATAALFFGGGAFATLFAALGRAERGPPGLTATIEATVAAGAAAWVDAVAIAVPAGAVVLAVNLVAGIAARVAPQIGILSVGLPAAALAGVVGLWASWGGGVARMADGVSEAVARGVALTGG